MTEREKNKAKNWVEKNFPNTTGGNKAALMLAYGAGLDAGLAEAQDILMETALDILPPEQMEQVRTMLKGKM